MRLLKNIIKISLATAFIAIVVFLGILSIDNPTFVVVFGLSCAFLAPITIIIFGSIYKNINADKRKDDLNKLLKIGNIDGAY